MEAPTIFAICTRVGRRIETLLHLRSNPARASAVGIGLVGVLAVAALCVEGAVTKQSSKAGQAAVEPPAQPLHSSENLPVLIYGGYRTGAAGHGDRVGSDPPESPVMAFMGIREESDSVESDTTERPVKGFGGRGGGTSSHSDPVERPEASAPGFGGYKRNAESEAAAMPAMGFGGYSK